MLHELCTVSHVQSSGANTFCPIQHTQCRLCRLSGRTLFARKVTTLQSELVAVVVVMRRRSMVVLEQYGSGDGGVGVSGGGDH